MLSSIRKRFHSFRENKTVADDIAPPAKPNRHQYSRPAFLRLTEEKINESSDHETRPVIGTDDSTTLPWGAGYAECVGVRRRLNEDQTAFGEIKLDHQLTSEQLDNYAEDTDHHQVIEASLRGIYFGVFDGHGGTGASLMVADQLINHLQEKLVDVRKDLFEFALKENRLKKQSDIHIHNKRMMEMKVIKTIAFDDLVIGALEAAFHSMDDHIDREKETFNISGGCCTLVALFLFGKLYIANAGDCRAVAYLHNNVIPLSVDFTADRDAERIYALAKSHPELITGATGKFTINHFLRHIFKDDVGQRLLCRRPNCSGWSYKEVTADDVQCSLICGKARGSRLMNCIGISRTLGDHDLVDEFSGLKIKPFLSCTPEVKILDLRMEDVEENDVLVMGSDGLWDFTTNVNMGKVISDALQDEHCDHRYGKAAREAVLNARGVRRTEFGGWRAPDGEEASYDDITALVIPLHHAATFTQLTLSAK